MKYLQHCSSIGTVMTNSRSKSEDLSKTTQSYLQEWLKEQLYKRRKDISSKYTTKGNLQEQNALEMLQIALDDRIEKKNEDQFYDDYLIGTPDIILEDTIIDIKCSWDCFTFPLFEESIPSKSYFYQLQGYMHLTGRKKAILAYCLVDTPEHLIESEYNRAVFTAGPTADSMQIMEQVTKAHSYDDIPLDLRVKTYNVDYKPEVIEAIYERIDQCRSYISQLSSKMDDKFMFV